VNSGSFQAFSGRIGGGLDGLHERKALATLLGTGTIQDEDEGVVYAESWRVGSTELHADYGPQGQIKSLQFSLPLLRARD
jgi:hypothetical protein